MQILVIRLSSIGDVVIQTAFTRWLKVNYPAAQITFLTSKGFENLLKNNSDVDRILSYSRKSGLADIKELSATAKELNKLNIDLVFDLHANSRTNLLSFFMSAPFIRVVKRSFRRNLLVKFKINMLKGLSSQQKRSIEDFNFLTGKELDWNELYIKRDAEEGLTYLGEKGAKENIIALAPVASFESKRWPINSFKKLIQLIRTDKSLDKYQIQIIAGPNDKYCAELGKDFFNIKNFQGKLSLQQSCQQISSASIMVSNDTGTLHIAESFGVPSIALFGSTSPDFGFRPHLKNSFYFWSAIDCSPCSKTGSRPCHRKQHDCMLDIDPSSVYSKVKEILNSDKNNVQNN